METKNELQVIHPSSLIEKAIEKGIDTQQLEKLMELHERWEDRQAKKEFHAAINQFQSMKPDLLKSKKVNYAAGKGEVNYSYNPLPKMQKAIDPVLAKCGLSYSWKQETKDDKIRITCTISHISGHREETWLEAIHDNTGSKNAIQAIGSTVSYLKRYTLENALGLSSDEDDDGKKSEKGLPVPSESQWKKIIEKFKAGDVEYDKITSNFKITGAQKKEIDKLTA